MNKRLGKGMDSLLSNKLEKAKESLMASSVLESKTPSLQKDSVWGEGATFMVDVGAIFPNPNQPRKLFKEKEIEELSQSIRENGIIQPLIVTKGERGFELIAGERRLKAAKKAGLEQVPVVIKNATEKEKMIMAIIENVQRSDLNCVEEALAYYQLMNEFKLTQEEVAKKLGKERSSVANFLRVLNLPREVIELLQKEELTFGHAKILTAGKDRESIIRMAHFCVANKLSVRELEREMQKAPKKITSENDLGKLEQAQKMNSYKQKLEQKTGFHFELIQRKSGSGSFAIKFNNEAEFNDVYEFIMKRN